MRTLPYAHSACSAEAFGEADEFLPGAHAFQGRQCPLHAQQTPAKHTAH
jgi:hypothetical protein